ncbi:MAG: toll/interleukin-1 receptor domain-containing protein [Bacteroidota bacterium]
MPGSQDEAMTYRYDVFVSYSRRDHFIVMELVARLMDSGLNVFYDEAEIAVGEPLMASVRQVIQDARYVLVVMSPHYFASQWAALETGIALQQEVDSNFTKVIPILVEDCEIPALLQTKVYADFRTPESRQEAFPRLLRTLEAAPISPTLKNQEAATKSPRLGSITPAVAESAEIWEMIEDLRSKVEGFMEGTESNTDKNTGDDTYIDPKLCFVAMPFGSQDLTDVYEYFIKPSIEYNCGMKCERGDDVFGSNVIVDDIR